MSTWNEKQEAQELQAKKDPNYQWGPAAPYHDPGAAPPPYTQQYQPPYHQPGGEQQQYIPQPQVPGQPNEQQNWQHVPLPPEQPIIHNQPKTVPGPITGDLFPQTDTKGIEGYLVITLCFTICGLVASSFALLVCALPIGFCIYKGVLVKDTNADSKKRYMQTALCGSIALMIGGIVCVVLYIAFIAAGTYFRAQASTTTGTY